MPRGDDNIAIFRDVHLRGAFTTGIEPEAAGNPAALIGTKRRAIMRMRHRSFNGFLEANTRKHRAMRGFCAFLRGVFQAQRKRVHAKLFGHFIQHAFNAISTNWRAWRAIGRDLGAVGNHIKAERMHIRDVIGREGAARCAANGRAR